MLSAEIRIVSKRKVRFDKQYVAQYIQTYFVLEFCFEISDFQTKLFDFKKLQGYCVYFLQSCSIYIKTPKSKHIFLICFAKFTKPVTF